MSFCTPCLCMQGCTKALEIRLLKWLQTIGISHVYSRIRRKANSACTHTHTDSVPDLLSYSVQLLHNSFSLFSKWCRDRRKRTRSLRGGQEATLKPLATARIATSHEEKHNERVFKKSQGAKLIPPTCTGILIWLFMWRGFKKKAANSYQVSCMRVRSGQRNCIALCVLQPRDSVPLYIASSLEHTLVGGDSSLGDQTNEPTPPPTHTHTHTLVYSHHSTLLWFWLARSTSPAFQSVTMSTRCFVSSSVILMLSLGPSLCLILTHSMTLEVLCCTNALPLRSLNNQLWCSKLSMEMMHNDIHVPKCQSITELWNNEPDLLDIIWGRVDMACIFVITV